MKSIVKTTLLLACATAIALPTITAAAPQTATTSTKVGVMNTTSNTSKSETTPSTGIANPLTMYNSIAEMENDVKFKVATPSVMPVGYDIVNIASINKEVAQINYDKGAVTTKKGSSGNAQTTTTITYRMAKGANDISGDYTQYPEEGTLKFNGNIVKLKGQDNKVNLATWTVNGMSYSLQFDTAISQTELVSIIATIPGAAPRTVTTNTTTAQ